MRRILAVLAACGLASVLVDAQAPTPYKLGTFQRQGTTFVGVVIRDAQVINLQVANAAVTTGNRITAPADMKDLIARYDNGVRQRIAEIVEWRRHRKDASRLRDGSGVAEGAAAHHVSDDDDERRGELPRARRGDGGARRATR